MNRALNVCQTWMELWVMLKLVDVDITLMLWPHNGYNNTLYLSWSDSSSNSATLCKNTVTKDPKLPDCKLWLIKLWHSVSNRESKLSCSWLTTHRKKMVCVLWWTVHFVKLINTNTCYRADQCGIEGNYSRSPLYRPVYDLCPQTSAEIHYFAIRYCDWCLCPSLSVALTLFGQLYCRRLYWTEW